MPPNDLTKYLSFERRPYYGDAHKGPEYEPETYTVLDDAMWSWNCSFEVVEFLVNKGARYSPTSELKINQLSPDFYKIYLFVTKRFDQNLNLNKHRDYSYKLTNLSPEQIFFKRFKCGHDSILKVKASGKTKLAKLPKGVTKAVIDYL